MQRLRLLAPAVALALLAIACSGGDDDDAGGSSTGAGGDAEETTTTLELEDAVAGADTAARELPATIEAWQAGDIDDDEMRRAARRALVAAGAPRDLMADPAREGEFTPLQVGAAELYFHHASIALEAVNEEEDDARRTALIELSRTVGELGARVNEWAAYEQDSESVEPEPLPGDDEAPLERDTQPEDAWFEAVSAIDTGAPELNEESAARFRDAVATLGEEPDPDAAQGHLISASLRLEWLVKAASIDAALQGLGTTSTALQAIDLDGTTDEEAAA